MRHPVPGKLWPIALPVLGLLAYAHDAPLSRLAADADPLTVTAGRFTVAAMAVWLLARLWGGRAVTVPTGPDRFWAVVCGLVLGLDLALWIASARHTTIANSLLLAHLTPVWIALIALGRNLRQPCFRELTTVCPAVAGAAVIANDSMLGIGGGHPLGDLLALSSGALTACYLLLVAARLRHLPLLSWLSLAYGAAAAGLWLVVLARGGIATLPDLQTLGAILAMGVICQALGHGLITLSLGWLSPCLVAVYCLGEPLLGSLLAWAYFGETVPPATAVGGVMILLGVYVGSIRAAPAALADRVR